MKSVSLIQAKHMRNGKINPEQAYTTLVIIWFALLVSQGLFVLVIFFARPELFRFDFTQPLLGNNAVVIGVLSLISLSSLVTSFVLRRRFLAQAIDEQKVELLQTALIAGCSACEVVSFIGILLAFLFSYQYFFFFSILGIAGTALHFPLRDNVHAASFRTLE